MKKILGFVVVAGLAACSAESPSEFAQFNQFAEYNVYQVATGYSVDTINQGIPAEISAGLKDVCPSGAYQVIDVAAQGDGSLTTVGC